jgi:hypothetical protein
MPNWVSNCLIIEGPVAALENLVLQATGPDKDGEKVTFTLNAFVKQPKDIFRGDLGPEEEKKHPGTKNWHGWQTKFWGTKWDCKDASIKKDFDPILDQMAEAFAGKRSEAELTGKVTYTFDTAWSAPLPVTKALAAQYPTLTVQHEWSDEDSSGSNHGRISYENGEETECVEFDGHNPTDELKEMAVRLKGYDPYVPRCDGCNEELSDEDVEAKQEHCEECRAK